MNDKTKEIKELEHFFINTTQISIRARDRMLAMLGAIKQELSKDSEILDCNNCKYKNMDSELKVLAINTQKRR